MLMDGQMSHSRMHLEDQEDFLAGRDLLLEPRRREARVVKLTRVNSTEKVILGQNFMFKFDFMEFRGK
jgi:hypothetical protein